MIDVRPVVSPAELVEVDRLYRQVFAVDEADTGLNVRLLTALTANGGHVTGAFDGAELAGFGLAFLARRGRDEPLFLYSQTVAVRPGRQGGGIGRLIKQGQRAAALADGIDHMRWTYDPMQARNAHFNLDVLGARAARVDRDYYGGAAHSLDRTERTDRVTVEWRLDGEPGRQASALPSAVLLEPGACSPAGDGRLVGLPAAWRTFRGCVGPERAREVRDRVVAAVADALAAGLVGVSCRRVGDAAAVYTFLPRDAS